LIVNAPPRADGQLSIVEVSETECVLSTGEVLRIKWEKLRHLCEWLAQNQSVIHGTRTWWTPDGNELVSITHAGPRSSPMSGATKSDAPF
jgi:phage baseplate assembly protein gpV